MNAPTTSSHLNHHYPVRIYYEDTDAGGVVYHARYLHFMERARTEWLREKGYEQRTLAQDKIFFVVRNVSVNYRRPAYLDDLVEIVSTPWIENEKTFVFNQDVFKEKQCLVCAQIQLVCVTGSPFRSMPIPPEIAALVQAAAPQANTIDTE